MVSMFHCTRCSSLPGIFDGGLKPMKPVGMRDAPSGVFLSMRRFGWMDKVTDGSSCAGALIEVDVDGLMLKVDPNPGVDCEGKTFDGFYCEEVIGFDRIRSIFISSDEHPCSFREVFNRDGPVVWCHSDGSERCANPEGNIPCGWCVLVGCQNPGMRRYNEYCRLLNGGDNDGIS